MCLCQILNATLNYYIEDLMLFMCDKFLIMDEWKEEEEERIYE